MRKITNIDKQMFKSTTNPIPINTRDSFNSPS
jgi:hypothetical protein